MTVDIGPIGLTKRLEDTEVLRVLGDPDWRMLLRRAGRTQRVPLAYMCLMALLGTLRALKFDTLNSVIKHTYTNATLTITVNLAHINTINFSIIITC